MLNTHWNFEKHLRGNVYQLQKYIYNWDIGTYTSYTALQWKGRVSKHMISFCVYLVQNVMFSEANRNTVS